jgi:hypothetical protein
MIVSGMSIAKAWAALTGSKKGNNVTTGAIIEVMDAILSNKTAELAFNAVMIANNTAAMYKNTHGVYAEERNPVTQALYTLIHNPAPGVNISPSVSAAGTLLAEALIAPNIAGIPISSASVSTDREVEVSESMVIVQSQKTKKYWTDNAIPRLKEWSITGYLTSLSPLDSGTLIKPSLQWQAYYLDVCATSRRPVLFKTNRGEFVKVQITNLHTDEEASYNNAIKVTLTLKEYNPYFIEDRTGDKVTAVYMGKRTIYAQ